MIMHASINGTCLDIYCQSTSRHVILNVVLTLSLGVKIMHLSIGFSCDLMFVWFNFHNSFSGDDHMYSVPNTSLALLTHTYLS